VTINDTDGILDPTNTSGPYFGKINPFIQAALCRYNPVLDDWDQRFRGFVADFNYSFHPSQRVNQLTLELVGIFELLNRIEMVPGGIFGDTPPSGQDIWFALADMDVRINQVLANSGIDEAFSVVFSGNVDLKPTPYTAGETPLTVIQESADAEFPGVSNVYEDRFGRLVVHGRLAKFDPAGVASGVTDDVWDWHDWEAGDGAAVEADPAQLAHIRSFSFSRGYDKIVNSVYLSSIDPEIPVVTDQDVTSIGLYGYGSRSWPNLLTNTGLLGGGSTTAQELQLFADYMLNNYADPVDRPTEITFRSKEPGTPGVAENWRLMSKVDISDRITVTIASPGGGGFTTEQFYVEGIRESSEPLNTEFDNDTVTLYVSPAEHFSTNPFPPT
jgi:hypothetical protein